MKITFHRNFKKIFKKRFGDNQKIKKRFHHRLEQFTKDPGDPQLKNHHLVGKLNQYWSFSITGDVRAIYEKISEDEAFIFDIGSHNQVY